ncbi:hypothetical protein [Roseobacter cerasinus]|uniref:hypothetical protein n=1 Tax=Roseobacter cerasinus TaxID=2602289 RepID=UPI001EEBD91C|nr:hypothetical protein [Roseobacter cerasinus]
MHGLNRDYSECPVHRMVLRDHVSDVQGLQALSRASSADVPGKSEAALALVELEVHDKSFRSSRSFDRTTSSSNNCGLPFRGMAGDMTQNARQIGL